MQVKELIEKLKEFPEDDNVLVIDADTCWQLPIAYIGKDTKSINDFSNGGRFQEDELPDRTLYFVINYNSK